MLVLQHRPLLVLPLLCLPLESVDELLFFWREAAFCVFSAFN